MCEHDILLGAIEVARCARHSRPPTFAVWTWACALPRVACPCTAADRFVVAHEQANAHRLAAADVVLADPRATARAAEVAVDALARLPGCALVVVPLAGNGVVAGDRTGSVVIREPAVCGTCLYPWLVNGGLLTALSR